MYDPNTCAGALYTYVYLCRWIHVNPCSCVHRTEDCGTTTFIPSQGKMQLVGHTRTHVSGIFSPVFIAELQLPYFHT